MRSPRVAIIDLTLNDFRMVLSDYTKAGNACSFSDWGVSPQYMSFLQSGSTEKSDDICENLLERMPSGAYAVATIDDSLKGEFSPGVIFCLRNEGTQTVSDSTYALSPYYLVYVKNNGSVFLQFTQTKKILDLLKKMSIYGKSVDGTATNRFSGLTRNGSDMSQYRNLLSKAAQALTGAAEESGVESLFSPGGTVINKNSFKGMNDFEVVSYLILLDHEPHERHEKGLTTEHTEYTEGNTQSFRLSGLLLPKTNWAHQVFHRKY